MTFRLLRSRRSSIFIPAQLNQLLAHISRFLISDGSADYMEWRDRFIWQRSQLLWQLIVLSKAIFAALESYGYVMHPHAANMRLHRT